MKKTIPLPKNRFLRISIIAVLAFIVIGIPLLAGSGAKNTAYVKRVLDTLSLRDENAWEQLLHPDCDKNIADMKTLLDSLKASGIDISGQIERVKVYYSKSFSTFRNEKDSLMDAHFLVGDEWFNLHLQYVKDSRGEGIVTLSIEKKNP